jgi:hypothetical protein
MVNRPLRAIELFLLGAAILAGACGGVTKEVVREVTVVVTVTPEATSITQRPLTPVPTAAPTATRTPTPTPPPTAAPVASPTWIVNTASVGCHAEPKADAAIVANRESGTVQAVDQVIRLADGQWAREVTQQCWIRNNPGPVRVFMAQAEAETFAVSVRPPKKEEARVLDPRELVGDPKAFVGRNIILQGNALNVDQNADYTWINLQAVVPGRTTTESIVVEMRPKVPQILKDECYRLYGIVEGTQTVRRLLTGATNEVPLVRGYTYEKSPVGRSGIGCAGP